MKFKSKLGCCLIMENVSFSIPHLRKIYLQNIYQKYIQKINSKQNVGLPFEISKFSKILIVIFPKIIFFQDVPIYFLIFFEVSWSLQR